MVVMSPCAGGIVFDDAGRLLLVKRANPPAQGTWSIPGGRCRPGEPAEAACVRELEEETGLVVEVLRWAGRVERSAPEGGRYAIDDFVCRLRSGTLSAGDDAADARWVTRDDLARLDVADGVIEALTAWALLPS